MGLSLSLVTMFLHDETIDFVKRLHAEAMDLVDQAQMARVHRQHGTAAEFLQAAFRKEREAALGATQDVEFEPTRSVLCRSAASLALECGEIREAERLIAMGLLGNPPEELANELRDLLEDVNFQRHLSLRGIRLEPNEIQLSLDGNAVGYGIADGSEFLVRVTNVERLVYRTSERKLGHPYRDRGGPMAGLRDTIGFFVTVPRAASFAITIRLGDRSQLVLPGTTFAEQVINEMLECLELFNSLAFEVLKSRINNAAYYLNFIGLARNLAPDGEKIRTVGITAIREGEGKRVVMHPREKALLAIGLMDSKRRQRQITQIAGFLRFANDIADHHEIRIVDDNQIAHRVHVPEGLMDDIVKPMWGSKVIITGLQKHRAFEMQDIQVAQDDKK
jgi:hypothetical protein